MPIGDINSTRAQAKALGCCYGRIVLGRDSPGSLLAMLSPVIGGILQTIMLVLVGVIASFAFMALATQGSDRHS
jgi:hypothetical protein